MSMIVRHKEGRTVTADELAFEFAEIVCKKFNYVEGRDEFSYDVATNTLVDDSGGLYFPHFLKDLAQSFFDRQVTHEKEM